MGDAVRRVQKHLQELSRDHLTSVEDRHHANLGWLQVSLQQLCKQIEVDVRVELTRPPRLSFSKPPVAAATGTDADITEQATVSSATTTSTTTAAVSSVVTRLEFDAIMEDESPKDSEKRHQQKLTQTQVAHENINAPVEEMAAMETTESEKQEIRTKRMVTKTRKVLKPKRIVTKVKTMVKKPKTRLPAVDISALKVVDLKAALKKRGLKQTGVKAVLADRLQEALDDEDAARAEFEEDECEEEVEIVEEILEEVDEEYEEEIELVDEAEVVVAVESASAVDDVGGVAGAENDDNEAGATVEDREVALEDEIATATHEEPESTRQHEAHELSQVEAQRMVMEDVDALHANTATDKPTNHSDASNLTQEESHGRDADVGAEKAKSSPKKSLSDMVVPPEADEIVRESDVGMDDLMSPAAKAFQAKVVSARKSPAKPKSQVADGVVTVPLLEEAKAACEKIVDKILTKSAPTTTADTAAAVVAVGKQSTSAVGVESAKPQKEKAPENGQSPAVAVDAKQQHPAVQEMRDSASDSARSIPALKETASSTRVQDRADKPAPETLVPPQKAATPVLSSSSLAKTMAETDRALKAAAAAEEASKTSSAPSRAAPNSTPAQDILARLKSLTPVASSDRSSSVSSYTASRRYTGSTNFVEDSQPDQSPHPRVSFASDFTTQATRAASSSQLEIQTIASKLKTPDSTSSVVPVSERVAHSEPRVNATKQLADTDAERKRREQQESIQREAQRLRLAAKQSAKKRFEEARGGNLLRANREKSKLETHRETSTPSSSASTVRSDSTSSTTSIPPITSDSASSSSTSSTVEKSALPGQKSSIEAAAVEEAKAADAAKAPATGDVAASSAAAPKPSANDATERSTPPASAAIQGPSTKKDVETKRVLPTRKRSSIAIDTSSSTLYPSKKRVSLSRTKEAPLPKRTSLTKEKPATEAPRKRTSTSREAPVVQAPKRRRSSVARDKAAPVATTNKKRTSTSSQDEPSPKLTTKATSAVAKPSTTVGSRVAAPSTSATMKRRDSVSSTVSSSSNVSTNSKVPTTTSVMSGGAVRKPANLVSGLHSFTSLLEKDSANLSSSQGSNTSTSSRAPGVSALKLAEKSRLLEQKKNLEKAKRKEALAKKYEEQRKADEDKRKKYALMKEKAERDARLKREQEQAAEKKQRELEMSKKRQQRLQEMRSGMEKKKALATEKVASSAVSKSASSASVAPVSRVAASTSAAASASSFAATTGKSTAKPTEPHELTTYAMSEHEESESEGSDDEKDTKRNAKNIPKWAQREHLERTMRLQFGPNSVDPTPSIFPDFIDSCDLEAIFEPTDVKKKRRFQRRTSSGNWLADRPTAREKAVYKKDMGFQR